MDYTSQDKERANKTFSKSCTHVRVGPQKRLSMEELMLSNHGAGEDSWESLGQQEDQLVNPKGNQPWIFTGRTDAEAPIVWSPDAKSQLIGKDADAGKDWMQEKKRVTEDEMVGWHHQLNGQELMQTLGESEGHRSLAYCSWWDPKSQTWLTNWTTTTKT